MPRKKKTVKKAGLPVEPVKEPTREDQLRNEIFELKEELQKAQDANSDYLDIVRAAEYTLATARSTVDACCRHKSGRKVCSRYGCSGFIQVTTALSEVEHKMPSYQGLPAYVSTKEKAITPRQLNATPEDLRREQLNQYTQQRSAQLGLAPMPGQPAPGNQPQTQYPPQPQPQPQTQGPIDDGQGTPTGGAPNTGVPTIRPARVPR